MTVSAFHKGQLQVDLAGRFDQSVVERGHHFVRRRRQVESPQMNRAMAEHVVGEPIVLHDGDVQFQLVEQVGQRVKGEGFAVDRIDGAALFAALLRAEVLVEKDALLFQMENHVRVTLVHHILVGQVGHLVEENGQLAHGSSSFTACCR
jgi:hypothetical protein